MITRTRTAVVVFALLALLCAVLSFAVPAGATTGTHRATAGAARAGTDRDGGLASGQVVAIGGGAVLLVLLTGGALMLLAGRHRPDLVAAAARGEGVGRDRDPRPRGRTGG